MAKVAKGAGMAAGSAVGTAVARVAWAAQMVAGTVELVAEYREVD